MMNIYDTLRTAAGVCGFMLIIGGAAIASAPVSLPNPILFVTQTPFPQDTSTITSIFGNHQTTTKAVPRGGDLYIMYTDGTIKNLTAVAGFGNAGLQGAGAIAVREPSMDWSGTKAVFSMLVGSPASQTDVTAFHWQLYEITGFGENETPIITLVPNQPANYNNMSPIYGTDERIIFTSDMPHGGESQLYPQIDEYRSALVGSGMYSLDPTSGDLQTIDDSPSGDFRPLLDSFGRIIFSRWDHLQRDSQADDDVLNGNTHGSFNYADETATAAVLNSRTEIYPEPQAKRTDLLAGTDMNGFEFNHFIPWQINEDGSAADTMNHVGRHDLNAAFGPSLNDDANLINFSPSPNRTNKNSITNMVELAEDPTHPGTFYGVDCQEDGTHGGGQVVTLAGAPTLDAQDMFINYITNRNNAFYLPENGTANSSYSGHDRTPLPLTNGTVIVAHSSENRVDLNGGTYANPVSRYNFRLCPLVIQSGTTYMAGSPMTPGVVKSLSYYGDSGLVSFSGTMWELDPVEVHSRSIPARLAEPIGGPEVAVMAQEGVDTTAFVNYLKQHNLAVIISRNVTHRNSDDHQQPFFLQVHGSTTQSVNPTGKVYDVRDEQMFESDHIRGYGVINNSPPKPGRRVLAQRLHDTSAHNPPDAGSPPGSVRIAADGSTAAFVPAHRAMAWQLTDSAGTPVVRERYWVTFASGEVRTCASCHGSNQNAAVPKQIIPQNEPEAFRELLDFWKANLVSGILSAPSLNLPLNGAAVQSPGASFVWSTVGGAAKYRLQLSPDSTFETTTLDDTSLTDTTTMVNSLSSGVTYYWRVLAINGSGSGLWSDKWIFSIVPQGSLAYAVNDQWNMVSLVQSVANNARGVLFPTSQSKAFSYQGGYSPNDTMTVGKGYWLKFSGAQNVYIAGNPINLDTIGLAAGWNMMGSVATPVDVNTLAQIPASIVLTPYYGYSEGYASADSIMPGQGYWVKSSQSGKLVLNANAPLPKSHPAADELKTFNMITLRDAHGKSQTLYFTGAQVDHAERFELPPPAPDGMFDARFANGRMVESFAQTGASSIALSNASYPVTISSSVHSGVGAVRLVVDGEAIPLSGKTVKRLDRAPASLSLSMQAASAMPKAFALEQNFPNPFNPSTRIEYALPVGARVRLAVFNTLGQEVAVLAEGVQSAGYKSAVWNAAAMPSGLYFIRIEAMALNNSQNSFTDVRKMMLIK